MLTTKILAALLSLLTMLHCSLASGQQLTFQQELIGAEMLPEQDSITLQFHFSNNTSKSITVRKITAGCNGCLTAKLKDQKVVYQPGETGLLIATYSSPSTSGKVTKAISLWYNDNLTGKPNKSVITDIDVVPLLSVSKRRLRWKLNSPNQKQLIELKTKDDKPLPLPKIQLDDPSLAKVTLTQQGKSGTYLISVTPHSTDKPFVHTVKFTTGILSKRNRAFSFYITCR